MIDNKKILITGGAGFIGGCLVRTLLRGTNSRIYNLDYMGYASDLSWLAEFKDIESRHKHLLVDLNNEQDTFLALEKADPDIIFHLAAESHVDRSIDNPVSFVRSNIIGTFNLLQASLKHFNKLNKKRKSEFRLLHVSTDEVFGTLNYNKSFTEESNYSPRSPYSATKASSDHLVNAWHHTYGLPVVMTNCSNNYGPYQFPEKLIPLAINKALNNQTIDLYGDGKQIRDWLYIDDHVNALLRAAIDGKIGEKYCIGGHNAKTNREIISLICECLDICKPQNKKYSSLIRYVKDRPGHDRRYSIDASKIKNQLQWDTKYEISEGIRNTVNWYIDNQKWCETVLRKANYGGERLGN